MVLGKLPAYLSPDFPISNLELLQISSTVVHGITHVIFDSQAINKINCNSGSKACNSVLALEHGFETFLFLSKTNCLKLHHCTNILVSPGLRYGCNREVVIEEKETRAVCSWKSFGKVSVPC